MLKIAFCDDNNYYVQHIQDLTNEYLKKNGIEGELYSYHDGRDLLKEYDQNKVRFDLVFLDIDMPTMDGIELGRMIRELDDKVLLIFTTHMEDRVYEAFQVSAFRFIRKRFLKVEIEECLQKAIEHLLNNQTYQLFKTGDGLIKIYTGDIIYLSYVLRRVEVHTVDGKNYRTTLNRFKDIIAFYEQYNFVTINRSYMINLKYLRSIDELSVTMEYGENLEVSRYRIEELYQALKKYAK